MPEYLPDQKRGNEMDRRTLVFGGTQFNGLALVRELVSAGHLVTVLNRGHSVVVLDPSVERLICDRSDYGALRNVLASREFDYVCDVSGYRTEDVTAAARLMNGRTGHYLFVSSTQIYGPSSTLPINEDHPVATSETQNEYGRQKIAAEGELLEMCLDADFPATVVAISMVFGPRNIVPDREQRMFIRLLRGRTILIPGDGCTLSQVGYVDDQARAMRLLLGCPITFGKRYNLSGHEYWTRNEYVRLFEEVLGLPARVVHIPPDVMEGLWDGHIDLLDSHTPAGGPERVSRQRYLLSHLVQHVSPDIHRWNRSVLFSTERLQREIGWSPRFTLKMMIEHTYEWFRSEGLDKSLSPDFRFEDSLISQLAPADDSAGT
jgi:nucleoside-diphosphate-sugar epimerase